MVLTPSETLKNRSYLGLLLSQFLAAFNDQAAHIVAIFFASDLLVRYVGISWIDDKAVITLVTASFISPFFFFSPLAGVLADKFSKRSIIVFWKLAEVAIMGLAVFALALPHFADLLGASQQTLSIWAAGLAISIVFLMGTHSAFFVPAKYGVMPELLHTSILSRGNGLLEGTSFTANILGITFGGAMYSWLGSDTSTPGVLIAGQEWIIGAVLLASAIVGAIGAFFIVPLPASAPERPLEWRPWVPLRANLKVLRQVQSLTVAVVGIAFFTFMTLFLRQILLYQGETDKELHAALRLQRAVETRGSLEAPGNGASSEGAAAQSHGSQQSELRIALLIGFVGLGVGIGCSLAGHLSGKKLELGLVPIGALFLIVTTASLALMVRSGGVSAGTTFGSVLADELRHHWTTVICLVLIGAAAGLYIVPFYTLLQQRAPKGNKGNLVAMSNFLNVAGGLLAVAFFYFLTFALEAIFALDLDVQDLKRDPGYLAEYIGQLQTQALLPRAQFLFASLITAGMIGLLLQQRPDFLVRSLMWLRTYRREALLVEGANNVPASGAVLIVTNFASCDDYLQFIPVTDRFTRFVLSGGSQPEDPRLGVARWVARKTGLLIRLGSSTDQPPSRDACERALVAAERTLQSRWMVAVSLPAEGGDSEAGSFLAELMRRTPTTVLPVYGDRSPGASPLPASTEAAAILSHLTAITMGAPLPAGSSLVEIAAAIDALRPPAGGIG